MSPCGFWWCPLGGSGHRCATAAGPHEEHVCECGASWHKVPPAPPAERAEPAQPRWLPVDRADLRDGDRYREIIEGTWGNRNEPDVTLENYVASHGPLLFTYERLGP